MYIIYTDPEPHTGWLRAGLKLREFQVSSPKRCRTRGTVLPDDLPRWKCFPAAALAGASVHRWLGTDCAWSIYHQLYRGLFYTTVKISFVDVDGCSGTDTAAAARSPGTSSTSRLHADGTTRSRTPTPDATATCHFTSHTHCGRNWTNSHRTLDDHDALFLNNRLSFRTK